MFEHRCTVCGAEDTVLIFTQAYSQFCDVCYPLNIRSREDAYRALHSRTMLESEGLDFGLFVSEFEMALPGSIEPYMSLRPLRRKEQNKVEGWLYFPEFKAVVEEYTKRFWRLSCQNKWYPQPRRAWKAELHYKPVGNGYS